MKFLYLINNYIKGFFKGFGGRFEFLLLFCGEEFYTVERTRIYRSIFIFIFSHVLSISKNYKCAIKRNL
jgi:hypothetical protein